MQQCPNCGHQNRPGIVFCENCGASLIGRLPLDTKSLDSEDEKAKLGVDASILTDVKVQGMAAFDEAASLRLEIEGSPEPIVFKPKNETIFGRRDPATGAMPDVDLTPFAGYRMGVSRRHAAIRFGDDRTLDLWDLGSSNGTFLNGQRLSAHRPYRLHDSDEIRLGQMVIRVFFQIPEKVPAAKPPVTVPVEPTSSPAVELPPTTVQVSGKEPEAAPLPKPPGTAPLDTDDEKPSKAEEVPAVQPNVEAPKPEVAEPKSEQSAPKVEPPPVVPPSVEAAKPAAAEPKSEQSAPKVEPPPVVPPSAEAAKPEVAAPKSEQSAPKVEPPKAKDDEKRD